MDNRKKYLVETQRWENYAIHDWNGKGDCPEYWKPKGGRTAIVYAYNKQQLWRLFTQESNGSKEELIYMQANPTQHDIDNLCMPWEGARYYYANEDGTWDEIYEPHIGGVGCGYDQRIDKVQHISKLNLDGYTLSYECVYTLRNGKQFTDTNKLQRYLNEKEVA